MCHDVVRPRLPPAALKRSVISFRAAVVGLHGVRQGAGTGYLYGRFMSNRGNGVGPECSFLGQPWVCAAEEWVDGLNCADNISTR